MAIISNVFYENYIIDEIVKEKNEILKSITRAKRQDD